MSAIFIGKAGVFGVVEAKPLRGFPPGRVKIRLRNKAFAKAFWRDGKNFRAWNIKEVGGFWEPGWEIGSNVRTEN